MDETRFDALSRALSGHPTRRATLRLLAGGLLGGLLPQRGAMPTRAAQPGRTDRDADGLYNDDEVNVYGTNPDLYDTDGDGIGDGEEVYLGTDPLTPNGGNVCAAGLTECFGVCVDVLSDPVNCSGCGVVCAAGDACVGGFCTAITQGDQGLVAEAGEPTGALVSCEAIGLIPCAGICCAAGEVCEGGICLGPVAQAGARMDVQLNECVAQGLTDCGGVCVSLNSNNFHCGACFNSCPLGGTCNHGMCVGPVCLGGWTDCGGYCADLQNDQYNCGVCHNLCDSGMCTAGSCGAICFGGGTVCTNDRECCSGDCGLDELFGAGVCV
jgi:Bacterial TSP3 repeat/Stigma-specific protein, Stig1